MLCGLSMIGHGLNDCCSTAWVPCEYCKANEREYVNAIIWDTGRVLCIAALLHKSDWKIHGKVSVPKSNSSFRISQVKNDESATKTSCAWLHMPV